MWKVRCRRAAENSWFRASGSGPAASGRERVVQNGRLRTGGSVRAARNAPLKRHRRSNNTAAQTTPPLNQHRRSPLAHPLAPRDYNGKHIQNPVTTSLDKKEVFQAACAAVCGHMYVRLESNKEWSNKKPTSTTLTYPQMLRWMEDTLPKDKRSFSKSMNELVKKYIVSSNAEERKKYIAEASTTAVGKLPVEDKKVKEIYSEIFQTLEKFPTSHVEGVVAVYVPWVLSAAVQNATMRLSGTKCELSSIHEVVQTAAAFSTLHESVAILETGAKREIGVLLLQERRIAELHSAARQMRGMALALAEKQFSLIYPMIRKTCNNLDAFRGLQQRQVAGDDGKPMFIYADVTRMELDTLQVRRRTQRRRDRLKAC